MADPFMDDGLSSMPDDGSFSSTEGSEVASNGRVEPRTPDPVPMTPSVLVPECFVEASFNILTCVCMCTCLFVRTRIQNFLAVTKASGENAYIWMHSDSFAVQLNALAADVPEPEYRVFVWSNFSHSWEESFWLQEAYDLMLSTFWTQRSGYEGIPVPVLRQALPIERGINRIKEVMPTMKIVGHVYLK